MNNWGAPAGAMRFELIAEKSMLQNLWMSVRLVSEL